MTTNLTNHTNESSSEADGPEPFVTFVWFVVKNLGARLRGGKRSFRTSYPLRRRAPTGYQLR
jgi:hypothetical protein